MCGACGGRLELIDGGTAAPLVHTLCLRGCVSLRSVAPLGDASLWPSLRSLDVTGCRALGVSLLAAALATAPAITGQARASPLPQQSVIWRVLSSALNLSGTRQLVSLDELAVVGHPGAGDAAVPPPTLLQRLRSLDLVRPDPTLLLRATSEPGCRCGQACCRSLSDIGALQDCDQLRSLSLRECKAITSLRGLSGATALTDLTLSGCRALSSLREVGHCLQLQRLAISSCRQLTDVEGLRGCAALVRLDLGGCRALRSLNALAEACGSLAWLGLSGCEKLADLGPLARATALATLNLSYCAAVQDITPLATCRSLQAVDLSFATSLRDAWALASCPALASLALTGCRMLPADAVARLRRARPALALKV